MSSLNNEWDEIDKFLEKKRPSGTALDLKEGQDVVIQIECITPNKHKRGNRTEIGYRLQIDEVEGNPTKASFEYLSADFNRLVTPHRNDYKGKKFVLGYTRKSGSKRTWKFEPCEEVD